MPFIVTLIAAGLGALALPFWTILLARKKNRSTKKWFTAACLAAVFVPIVGSLAILILLLNLPAIAGTQESGQKPLLSDRAITAIGSMLSLALIIGIVGIVPAVWTILQSLGSIG